MIQWRKQRCGNILTLVLVGRCAIFCVGLLTDELFFMCEKVFPKQTCNFICEEENNKYCLGLGLVSGSVGSDRCRYGSGSGLSLGPCRTRQNFSSVVCLTNYKNCSIKPHLLANTDVSKQAGNRNTGHETELKSFWLIGLWRRKCWTVPLSIPQPLVSVWTFRLQTGIMCHCHHTEDYTVWLSECVTVCVLVSVCVYMRERV